MAINKPVVSATPISQNTNIVIEMVLTRPVLTAALDAAVSPNTLFGWYNATTDKVELFMSDFRGERMLRVG